MKFDIREDKLTEFLLGVGMFIAGIILLTKNIYVSTPMFNHGIRIGGLSSKTDRIADRAFLDAFEREAEFKLLMCHHPEMYRDYVRGRDIDFTICGHAHGGQIQIAGHGLYAPGQGLFPRLTHGVHDGGKMMISRGMTNGAKPRIPRIGNPCELIILELVPEEPVIRENKEKGE